MIHVSYYLVSSGSWFEPFMAVGLGRRFSSKQGSRIDCALSEVVPSARQGRVAVAEPVFSKSPPWTMSAAPR